MSEPRDLEAERIMLLMQLAARMSPEVHAQLATCVPQMAAHVPLVSTNQSGTSDANKK